MAKGSGKEIHQLKARIKLESARRGLSVSQFARNTGRTPQALNDIINRNNPRLDILREFAEAFGMTMADFVRPVTAAEYGEVIVPRE